MVSCFMVSYIFLEQGSGAGFRSHTRNSRRSARAPIQLPQPRGSITAIDVIAAPAGPERDAAIDRWCETVWKAFSDSRDVIVRLVAENGIA